MDYSPPGSSVHRDSPGKNTGVGCHVLQGTEGSNPGIEPSCPTCKWILYQLSHQGSPRILEWVAYPFSRGSSLPRNQTGVSCISGRFFTSWATRETHSIYTAAKSLQSCLTLCDPMDYSPPGSSVRGDSPGKNTGVGCHALLQGIFPTQGSNISYVFLTGSWVVYH